MKKTLALVALCTVVAAPAFAAPAGHHRHYPSSVASGIDGYGRGPSWQGEPTDNLPIWRNGYYQGNDPDQFIRSQLMRDPRDH
jgi:hypothetical protein